MYKWRVRFEIIPPLLKSEIINGYDFRNDDKSGKTYVDIFYETSEINEKLKDRHYEDEFAEVTCARRHQSKIKRLLLQRMINLKVVYSLEVKCLGIEGFDRPPRLIIKFKSKNNILDEDDSLKASSDFWKSGFKFETDNQKKKSLEEEVYRIANWFSLAEKQNDNISFILAWIAFNGLYSLFSRYNPPQDGRIGDQAKWKHTINELLNEKEAEAIVSNYSNLFDSLQSFDIIRYERSGNVKYNEKLKSLRNSTNSDSKKIIECATNCIYIVRNQVFHEASLTETEDERCKISKHLLIIIAMKCLRNFVSMK